MKNTYKDGAIVATGCYYDNAEYHVANNKVGIIFDGKGAINTCSLVGAPTLLNRGTASIFVDDKAIDAFGSKTVVMQGRHQNLIIDTGVGELHIEQFVDAENCGVYLIYNMQSCKRFNAVDVCLYGLGGAYIVSEGLIERWTEGHAINVRLTPKNLSAKMFLDFSENEHLSSVDFDKARADCQKEIENVKVPQNLNEYQKAMFLNCYFCALQNYKEHGEFKGFTAGHRYMSPLRTYYRDSYYTVLPMYNGHIEKVKNQILTLAKGVAGDGTCPSAVRRDLSAFWGNHYDSPSFFVIMLYDYVHFTKDFSFLSQNIGSGTLLERAEKVIEKLSRYKDESGLLCKAGRFNKNDWADEVHRYGYVTYDEVLYARALFALSRLFSYVGNQEKSENYSAEYVCVKDAINRELWDEEKGYYVNFKNEDYVEDNLSVDTVLAVIFGIADKSRARIMLENMEKILETKNNKEIKIKDFGVACVYPLYQRSGCATHKSLQPFTYHNASNWPYWSAMYAYAKKQYGMEYSYPLESWFSYNVERGNYTPIEYFSPICADGSLLQAWSGVAAFVFDDDISGNFFDTEQ